MREIETRRKRSLSAPLIYDKANYINHLLRPHRGLAAHAVERGLGRRELRAAETDGVLRRGDRLVELAALGQHVRQVVERGRRARMALRSLAESRLRCGDIFERIGRVAAPHQPGQT